MEGITEDQALIQLERDSEWFSSHYDEIKKKYEGMTIAVKDERIIGASKTLLELFKIIEKSEEDPRLVLIESIPPKTMMFIL